MSPKDTNRQVDALSDDALLTTSDVAHLFRVPKATIYRWRYLRTGPVGYRVGRHLRFRRRDVDRWLETKRDQGRGR